MKDDKMSNIRWEFETELCTNDYNVSAKMCFCLCVIEEGQVNDAMD